jgi:hypothetical protein
MGLAQASTHEAQSFDRLRRRLAAIPDVVQPPLDPRSVALRALVVVDSLSQPEMRQKLAMAERGGADLRCIEDLRESARALLYIASHVEPLASQSGERVTEVVRDEAHIAHLSLPTFADDSVRELAARLAHMAFIGAFVLALVVAVLGVSVASFKSF